MPCDTTSNALPTHGPLTRNWKLWHAHAPGMPGTFPRYRRLVIPTCMPSCMSGSLTSGVRWSCWRGKRSDIPHACATRNFVYLVRGSWLRYLPNSEETMCCLLISWFQDLAIWEVQSLNQIFHKKIITKYDIIEIPYAINPSRQIPYIYAPTHVYWIEKRYKFGRMYHLRITPWHGNALRITEKR